MSSRAPASPHAPAPASTQCSAPQAELLASLRPVLARIAELAPATRRTSSAIAELEGVLEHEFPVQGPWAIDLGRRIAEGIAAGWLCDRGAPDARFSRIAKPGPETSNYSIDCVSMVGNAVDHTHPLGEITLGFAAPGSDPAQCRFDGRPPGWVFMPPESRHVPTVEGGRMHLIYFLPDGAVKWHMD